MGENGHLRLLFETVGCVARLGLRPGCFCSLFVAKSQTSLVLRYGFQVESFWVRSGWNLQFLYWWRGCLDWSDFLIIYQIILNSCLKVTHFNVLELRKRPAGRLIPFDDCLNSLMISYFTDNSETSHHKTHSARSDLLSQFIKISKVLEKIQSSFSTFYTTIC